ncbi:hypothetical protein RB195_026003 [Necator americanus]|uniref:Phlebovirus glycoprotein G2 fusion domain-containing protein n=1 Tax=Necator americanus TaxID=51031 RepID=A0ABR1EWZ2_NECAM
MVWRPVRGDQITDCSGRLRLCTTRNGNCIRLITYNARTCSARDQEQKERRTRDQLQYTRHSQKKVPLRNVGVVGLVVQLPVIHLVDTHEILSPGRPPTRWGNVFAARTDQLRAQLDTGPSTSQTKLENILDANGEGTK